MQLPSQRDVQTVSLMTGILPTDLQYQGGSYNNHYYRVVYQGKPIGAFWWQHTPQHWQGMNNANRLLRPTDKPSDTMIAIVDGIEAGRGISHV